MRGGKAPTLQPGLAVLAVKAYRLLTARAAEGPWDVPGPTLIVKLRLSKVLFVFGAALEAHDTCGVRLRWTYSCRGGGTVTGDLRMVLTLLQNACIDIALMLETLF